MIAILSPERGVTIDEYCTGMIFGLQGSKILVHLANTLITPMGEDGKAKKFSTDNLDDIIPDLG